MSRTLMSVCSTAGGLAAGTALATAVLWPQLTSARRQAHTDDLTGLANRRALTGRLRQLVLRGDHPFTLALLDLDDFKTLNDTYGHAAGDQILRAVAHRLDLLPPPVRLVARLGGDEFVLLIDTDPATAYPSAALACHLLAHPVRLPADPVYVHASIGLAGSRPGLSDRQLLHHADLALYEAKTSATPIRTYAHRPGTEVTERPGRRCRDRRQP